MTNPSPVVDRVEQLIGDGTGDGKPSFLLRVPCRFAGLVPDYVWLAGRTDRILARVLAVTLAVTVSLAFMYGAVSWSIFRTGELQLTVSVVFVGFCVAGAIYALDRALLELVKRPFEFAASFHELETAGPGQHSGYANLLISTAFALVTRLGVAVVMALIVSEPLLLVFFETDIEQVLQERREDDLAIVLSEIDDEFEPLLAVEMPRESVEVAQLRTDLAVFEQQKSNLANQMDEAESENERYLLLATCEQDGSQDVRCDQLRASGDVSLSGEETCGPRCQSHNQSASRAVEQAERIRGDLDDLEVQITSKTEELRVATEGQRQTLFGFVLDALDESGRQFDIESPVSAAKECRRNEARMLYRTLSFQDPRSLALFDYCGTDVEEIREAVLPRSGLNPRQDAFNVLTNCSDPLGLRSQAEVIGEPQYCSRIASGPDSTTGRTSTASGVSDSAEGDSFWTQIITPLEPIFLVPNSELGRTASRIRWMLLILDTMPIIFKLGMNFRTHRPYDALVALEQHRNLYGIQTARLQHDRLIKESQPVASDPSDATRFDGRTLTRAFARWRRETNGSLNQYAEDGESNSTAGQREQEDSSGTSFANLQNERLSTFDTSADPFKPNQEDESFVIDLTEPSTETTNEPSAKS